MKVKNLAKNAIWNLNLKSFGPMSHPVLKKLCVRKPELKRQAKPKLRFQNENFIVAPCTSTAKDYFIQKLQNAFESNI